MPSCLVLHICSKGKFELTQITYLYDTDICASEAFCLPHADLAITSQGTSGNNTLQAKQQFSNM